MTSADVRSKLVESRELDLVGPRPGLGDADEILPQSPSRWYLTAFPRSHRRGIITKGGRRSYRRIGSGRIGRRG